MNDELQQRLAATLDRSLEQLDGDTVARLAQARRRALQRRRGALIGLALAAGIAALLLVSNLPVTDEQPLPTLALQLPAGEEGYLQVDPQLLSDLEMLELIGELPDAT